MAEFDWSRGAAHRWRYWIVDPDTWQDSEELRNVRSCEITRDLESDTMESATLSFDGDPPEGELIVRAYLEATQRFSSARICVGTMVLQTPAWSGDGLATEADAECYGVLLDLADDGPPVGFAAVRGSDPLALAATYARAAMRAPVGSPPEGVPLTDHYVAGDDESWLDTVRNLCSLGGCDLTVDARGNVRFEPRRRVAALSPVATFDDGNSSVLGKGIEVTTDMYKVPNVVRVVWSEGTRCVVAEAVNEDAASRLSVPSRGRRIVETVRNPDELSSGCTESSARAVAAARLSDLSHVERSVTFEHALTAGLPSLGECVRLRYDRYHLDCRARVTRQVIRCETGAMVECTATWTE